MKWKAIKAFILKELKITFRERETVFWIFAWPLIWILLAAFVFIPPTVDQPITLKVGIVNYDINSTYPFNGTYFTNILSEIEYRGVKLFEVTEYLNETKMVEDIRKGKLDGGFVIPEGFGEKVIIGQSNLTVYIGARDIQRAQISEAILKGFIERMNKDISMRKVNETMKYIVYFAKEYVPAMNFSLPSKVNMTWIEFVRMWYTGLALPIDATFKSVKPQVLTSRETIVGWLTIGAIGMVMLYTGFTIGSIMAVAEKERGTLRRLLASPASSTDMLIGKTIAGIVTLGLASLFSIAVGIGCGARILWNPFKLEYWLVPLIFTLIALFTIGIGMLLSLIAKTSRGASSLSVILGLMFAFLAGIWFPKWWFPSWMRILADIFPATWGIDAIRSIIVYEMELKEVLPSILGIAVASAISYALGILAYKRLLRKYAEA